MRFYLLGKFLNGPSFNEGPQNLITKKKRNAMLALLAKFKG